MLALNSRFQHYLFCLLFCLFFSPPLFSVAFERLSRLRVRNDVNDGAVLRLRIQHLFFFLCQPLLRHVRDLMILRFAFAFAFELFEVQDSVAIGSTEQAVNKAVTTYASLLSQNLHHALLLLLHGCF